MSPPHTPDDAQQRFRTLYLDVHADALRFVRRRLPPEALASAEDVLAEAMLVAWRRFSDAPRRLDAQRAWVFGIARNCLLTAHRTRGRQQALTVRLADTATTAATAANAATTTTAFAAVTNPHTLTTSPHEELVAGLDLAAAWRRLSAAEQEVLALTVFEDLTSTQAAQVLAITPTGYRLRLMRARRALRTHLNGNTTGHTTGHTHGDTPRNNVQRAQRAPVPRRAPLPTTDASTTSTTALEATR